MANLRLSIAVVVCLVVVSVLLGLCTPASGAPPKFVKIEVAVLSGSTEGDEAIDGGGVSEEIVKAIQTKLKLRQLEPIDKVELTGASGIDWYAKVGENNDNYKDMNMTLIARFWGNQKDSARFGVSVESKGTKIFNRNLVLKFDEPQVQFEKLGKKYLILVLTAKPW